MKYKNTYLFADISVETSFSHGFLEKQCRDYITKKKPEIFIDITESDIENEAARSEDKGFSDGYFESLAFYRRFCDAVAEKGIILFHSCAIAVDGFAYLFAAPSGTGKSTHAMLWKQLLGDRAHIINGDKPLIRVAPDKITVYGTPWDGKEHQSENASAPIAGICLLSRGEKNEIHRIGASEAMPLLYRQTYRTSSAAGLSFVMKNLTEAAERIPLWQLYCNISPEAAKTSYNAMTGSEKRK